jgi:hypothetical protein
MPARYPPRQDGNVTVTAEAALGPGPHGKDGVVRARDDRQPEPVAAVSGPLAAELPERLGRHPDVVREITGPLLASGRAAVLGACA